VICNKVGKEAENCSKDPLKKHNEQLLFRKKQREMHGAKRTQTSKVMTETTTRGKLQRILFIYFRKMKG